VHVHEKHQILMHVSATTPDFNFNLIVFLIKFFYLDLLNAPLILVFPILAAQQSTQKRGKIRASAHEAQRYSKLN
jgi:hypothetical protein